MASKKEYVKLYQNYFGMKSEKAYTKRDMRIYNEVNETLVFGNEFWRKEVDNRIAYEEKQLQSLKGAKNKKVADITKEVTDLHNQSLDDLSNKYSLADEEYKDAENEYHMFEMPQDYIDELNSLKDSMDEIKDKYSVFDKTTTQIGDNGLMWEVKERSFENLVSLIESAKKHNPDKTLKEIADEYMTSKDALDIDYNMNRAMQSDIKNYLKTKEYDNSFPENIKNYIDEKGTKNLSYDEIGTMIEGHVHEQIKTMSGDICEYINRKQAVIDKQEQSPELALSKKIIEKLKIRNEIYDQKTDLEAVSVKQSVNDKIKEDTTIQEYDNQIAEYTASIDNLKKYKEMRPALADNILDVDPEQVKFAKQEFFNAKEEFGKLNGWQQFWANFLPAALYGKANIANKINAYKEVFNDLGVKPGTLDAEYARYAEDKAIADGLNSIENVGQVPFDKEDVRVKDNDLNMALGDLTDLEKGAQKNDAQKTQYKRYEVQLDNEDKKIDAPQINVPKN